MPEKRANSKYRILLNITVAAWATVMFLFLPGCNGRDKNMADAVSEKDSLPDMRTTGVTSLVSDSGMIRYRSLRKNGWFTQKETRLSGPLKKDSIWKSLIHSSAWMPASRQILLIIMNLANYGNSGGMFISKANGATSLIPN